MKSLLLSAAALAALLSAPAAMAQDQNNDNQPKQERANRGDKPDRGGDNQMNGPNGGTQGPGNMSGPNAKDRDNNNKDRDANDNNNRDRDNNQANDRNNGPDKKVVVHKTVDRSVILKVRANITAPRKFHAARAYVRPAGWYEHRWTYGERLPRNFFASDFWITDFGVYGLIAPWDGYEWVRYGDDALLIDVDTGEVIRVEYGLFY